ncbi:MAG: hypothetical protein RL235_736 [Chlamydiota bacterium]|jgi:hypothetical protein
MFGLEKEDKKGKRFMFDLEKEIHEKPARAKEILSKVEKRILEIKTKLREGAGEKEFDRLGVLLHGYSALQKVLRKVK